MYKVSRHSNSCSNMKTRRNRYVGAICKKKCLCFLLMFMGNMFLAASPGLAEQKFGTIPWETVETAHTIIKYKSPEALFTFHKSVKYGRSNWNKSWGISAESIPEIERMLIPKVDAIFERAQKILDMRKKIKPVSIEIYPDSNELKRIYRLIYREKCKLRAWYRFRTNTVYINAEDVHAGMLAHELAHGIIDNFFKFRPPSETAEILARYVDSHL